MSLYSGEKILVPSLWNSFVTRLRTGAVGRAPFQTHKMVISVSDFLCRLHAGYFLFSEEKLVQLFPVVWRNFLHYHKRRTVAWRAFAIKWKRINKQLGCLNVPSKREPEDRFWRKMRISGIEPQTSKIRILRNSRKRSPEKGPKMTK